MQTDGVELYINIPAEHWQQPSLDVGTENFLQIFFAAEMEAVLVGTADPKNGSTKCF